MKRTLAVLAVAVFGATGLYGIAGGLVPDGDGVVHTCYSQANGTWRPIDAPSEQCRRGEAQLDLNQEGPQGERGPAGPKGDPGAIDGAPCGEDGSGTMSLQYESTPTPGLFKVVPMCAMPVSSPPDPSQADGTPCDDDDPNTHDDVYSRGTCHGTPINCDDGNPFTVDAARNGACERAVTPEGWADNDGDGVSNFDEADCGTDWNDANSVCV